MDKKKTAAASVLSGVAGAAAGAVGSHVFENIVTPDDDANDAKEEDSNEPKVKIAEHEPAHEDAQDTEDTPDYVNGSEEENGTEPEHDNVIGTEPEEPEPQDEEVQVVAFQTETTANGQQMDVVYVTDGETNGMIVDVDQDGTADALVVDANHNNQVDENEVLDIRGQDVAMAPYEQAASMTVGEEPVSQESGQVEVIGTDTLQDESGNEMDVAYLSDGETNGMVADVNQDGVADYMVIDENHDGQIENDEIYDISGEGAAMPDVYDEPSDTGDEYLASNEDYINDADVDVYNV